MSTKRDVVEQWEAMVARGPAPADSQHLWNTAGRLADTVRALREREERTKEMVLELATELEDAETYAGADGLYVAPAAAELVARARALTSDTEPTT